MKAVALVIVSACVLLAYFVLFAPSVWVGFGALIALYNGTVGVVGRMFRTRWDWLGTRRFAVAVLLGSLLFAYGKMTVARDAWAVMAAEARTQGLPPNLILPANTVGDFQANATICSGWTASLISTTVGSTNDLGLLPFAMLASVASLGTTLALVRGYRTKPATAAVITALVLLPFFWLVSAWDAGIANAMTCKLQSECSRFLMTCPQP